MTETVLLYLMMALRVVGYLWIISSAIKKDYWPDAILGGFLLGFATLVTSNAGMLTNIVATFLVMPLLVHRIVDSTPHRTKFGK